MEPNYKKIAHALWSLLDDIDTYGDMLKPDHTPYFKRVNEKADERFKYADSDGYSLFFKNADCVSKMLNEELKGVQNRNVN